MRRLGDSASILGVGFERPCEDSEGSSDGTEESGLLANYDADFPSISKMTKRHASPKPSGAKDSEAPPPYPPRGSTATSTHLGFSDSPSLCNTEEEAVIGTGPYSILTRSGRAPCPTICSVSNPAFAAPPPKKKKSHKLRTSERRALDPTAGGPSESHPTRFQPLGKYCHPSPPPPPPYDLCLEC